MSKEILNYSKNVNPQHIGSESADLLNLLNIALLTIVFLL